MGCGVSAAVSGDGAMMSSSGSCQYYAFPTRVYALAVGADGDRFAVGSAQRHSMNNYIAVGGIRSWDLRMCNRVLICLDN